MFRDTHRDTNTGRGGEGEIERDSHKENEGGNKDIEKERWGKEDIARGGFVCCRAALSMLA
jgi:hypothetical protein